MSKKRFFLWSTAFPAAPLPIAQWPKPLRRESSHLAANLENDQDNDEHDHKTPSSSKSASTTNTQVESTPASPDRSPTPPSASPSPTQQQQQTTPISDVPFSIAPTLSQLPPMTPATQLVLDALYYHQHKDRESETDDDLAIPQHSDRSSLSKNSDRTGSSLSQKGSGHTMSVSPRKCVSQRSLVLLDSSDHSFSQDTDQVDDDWWQSSSVHTEAQRTKPVHHEPQPSVRKEADPPKCDQTVSMTSEETSIGTTKSMATPSPPRRGSIKRTRSIRRHSSRRETREPTPSTVDKNHKLGDSTTARPSEKSRPAAPAAPPPLRPDHSESARHKTTTGHRKPATVGPESDGRAAASLDLANRREKKTTVSPSRSRRDTPQTNTSLGQARRRSTSQQSSNREQIKRDITSDVERDRPERVASSRRSESRAEVPSQTSLNAVKRNPRRRSVSQGQSKRPETVDKQQKGRLATNEEKETQHPTEKRRRPASSSVDHLASRTHSPSSHSTRRDLANGRDDPKVRSQPTSKRETGPIRRSLSRRSRKCQPDHVQSAGNTEREKASLPATEAHQASNPAAQRSKHDRSDLNHPNEYSESIRDDKSSVRAPSRRQSFRREGSFTLHSLTDRLKFIKPDDQSKDEQMARDGLDSSTCDGSLSLQSHRAASLSRRRLSHRESREVRSVCEAPVRQNTRRHRGVQPTASDGRSTTSMTLGDHRRQHCPCPDLLSSRSHGMANVWQGLGLSSQQLEALHAAGFQIVAI